MMSIIDRILGRKKGTSVEISPLVYMSIVSKQKSVIKREVNYTNLPEGLVCMTTGDITAYRRFPNTGTDDKE